MARRPRLHPAVGVARNLIRRALDDAGVQEGSLVLVACSGGPDSLALAGAAAFLNVTGSHRVGAVVVDHGLQPGSGGVAEQARRHVAALGLDPVETRRAVVSAERMGPEAAARTARYEVLDAAAVGHGAAAVLLGHTLDDQAEQVLLGLTRGSGTRSLAGMPASRGLYLRPFLDLRRADTEEICRALELDPWHDPTNSDPAFVRSRVRSEVLPYLEDRLGPGIAQALYRTSRILGQDADYLDSVSGDTYAGMRQENDDGAILLSEDRLRALPPSLRQRVVALAAVELGGSQPSFERVLAVESLLERRGSAGPVQLGGKVSVYRQVRGRSVPHGDASYGSLVFKRNLRGLSDS